VSYYISFLIFAVVAYLIVTDDSVAAAFYFVMKLIRVEYEKRKWWLLNNPRNPIVKYLMWRRALKLAKEIENEIQMERQSRMSNNNSEIVE
jgi:uncharacterized membrane protein YpjA